MKEIKTQGNFMVYGPEGERRAAFALESDRRQFEATKGLVETCQMVVGCIGDNLGSHFPDHELQPALDALEIALEPFKQPAPAPSFESIFEEEFGPLPTA